VPGKARVQRNLRKSLLPSGQSGRAPDNLSAVFHGAGEIAILMRTKDWSSTPLGPVETWSPDLVQAVRCMLELPYPVSILWGPEFTQLYNDGYRPFLGTGKHPRALGAPVRETWRELWPVFRPLLTGVLSTGEPRFVEDALLLMNRDGYDEETYFTFALGPIRDAAAGVGGVLAVLTERTRQVLSERRLRLLDRLAEQLELAAISDDLQGLCARMTGLLEGHPDVHFALIYLFDEGADATSARLAASAGVRRQARLRLQGLGSPAGALSGLDATVLARACELGLVLVEGDPLCRSTTAHAGSAAVERAAVLAIGGIADQAAHGVLILGLNPHRPFDEEYRQFCELVGRSIGATVGLARGFARQRALRQEAEHARERVDAILASISGGFVVLDRNARYTYVNDEAARLLERPAYQLVGRIFWDVWPSARHSAFHAPMRRALEEGIPQHAEAYNPRIKRWVRADYYPSSQDLAIHFRDTTAEVEDRARLGEQARLVARLEERARIAMDLHDNVAQTLYAVALQLAASEQQEEFPDTGKAALRHARTQVLKALQQVRFLSTAASASTGCPDLLDALQALVQQTRASGAAAELRVGVDPQRLDPAAVPHVLAIAREALSNIMKHAAATAVLVELATDARGAVMVRIRDNGRGFSVRSRPNPSVRACENGLRNMRVRAAMMGAHMSIRSRLARGTEVCLTLPPNAA
jgi:signal transduction histidine kinase